MLSALRSWTRTSTSICNKYHLNPYSAASSSRSTTRCLRGLTVSAAAKAIAKTNTARIHSLALDSPEAHAVAQTWVDGFRVGDIPDKSLETSYSRSSGPGGQHVNKTNSKATVRCDVSFLPAFVREPLTRSPHYLPSPPSLLISSQTTRSAPKNLAHALETLHGTITSAARSVIVGATSAAQKARVRGFEGKGEAMRREGKTRQSEKKSARRDW